MTPRGQSEIWPQTTFWPLFVKPYINRCVLMKQTHWQLFYASISIYWNDIDKNVCWHQVAWHDLIRGRWQNIESWSSRTALVIMILTKTDPRASWKWKHFTIVKESMWGNISNSTAVPNDQWPHSKYCISSFWQLQIWIMLFRFGTIRPVYL